MPSSVVQLSDDKGFPLRSLAILVSQSSVEVGENASKSRSAILFFEFCFSQTKLAEYLGKPKLENREKEIELVSEPAKLAITESAARAIREVLDSSQVPEGYRLRVGVRTQGMACAGMSFMLGFDKKKEEDMEMVVDGIPVVMDRRHSMYLLGMEIDWHEDEHQKGFVFNNPSQRKD